MRKLLFAATVAAAGMGSTAHAADMYSGSMKDEPMTYAPAAPIFAGLYVGGSLGFGVGDTSGAIVFDTYEDKYPREAVLLEAERGGHGGGGLVELLEALLQSKYDVNGAIYGAHLGYNVQRGNLVYGVELGYNGTDMDGSSPCVVIFYCQRSLDWYATGVGRLGYASGNTMFYGFGGVAWGEVETEIGLVSPGLTFLKGSETHVGWTAGVGIEHALTDRFIVGIEYSHVDLGEEDTTLSFDGYALEGIKDQVDLKFDAVKVRASYKLSGGHEPLESMK